MLNNFPNFEDSEQSDQVKALRRLACMYHAAGNYAKAEELLKIAEQWQNLNRSRGEGRRFGQRDHDAAA